MPGPADVLRLALWFGLLTGLVEVALLGVQRYGLGRFVFLTRDVIWMAPLANVLFALVLAGLTVLAGRLLRRPPGLAVLTGVLATFAFTAVLFMYPRMHRGAEMALAAGLGITLARLADRYRPGFHRLVRRTVWALVVLVAGAGLGLHGWLALRERRAMAAVPEAPAGAPNVLLIILDTVRSMSLSLYGYDRETTPELERWAASGTTWNTAFATSPWTLPSHASMFTGRWPHDMSADWGMPLDGTWPTLAEELAKRGYVTGGIAANLLFTTWESGLTRGFVHYEDFPVTFQQVLKSSSVVRVLTGQRWFKHTTGWRQRLARQSAADVNQRFLGWLDGVGDRPYFAFLNYLDAHGPYLPPAPFDTVFPPVRPLGNPEADFVARWTPEEVSAARDEYDRSVAYLDHHIGRLLDTLQARGQLENTLVIISSDHGEEFFEHGLMGHGNSLFRTSVQVPLVLRFPGRVPGGARVDTPVSNRDIPATVMDLLGHGAASPFPGRSLRRFWSGDSVPPDTVLALVAFARQLPARYPVSRGDMSSVLLDGYRYIRLGDGEEQLYDAAVDTFELHNMADSSFAGPIRDRLRGADSTMLGPGWEAWRVHWEKQNLR